MIFDVLLASIFGSSVLLGMYEGAIKLFIGFICFVLSIVCTAFVFYPVLDLVRHYIQNPILLNIASCIAAYLLAIVGIGILHKKLGRIIADVCGGVIDRILGTIFGAIRGLLICSIIFGALAIFVSGSYIKAIVLGDVIMHINPSDYPEWMMSSQSNSIITNVMRGTWSYCPTKFQDDILGIRLPTLPKTQVMDELLERELKHLENRFNEE